MILEYKISCDNCNCIIDGVKETFITTDQEGAGYLNLDFCNESCEEGNVCKKCGVNDVSEDKVVHLV